MHPICISNNLESIHPSPNPLENAGAKLERGEHPLNPETGNSVSPFSQGSLGNASMDAKQDTMVDRAFAIAAPISQDFSKRSFLRKWSCKEKEVAIFLTPLDQIEAVVLWSKGDELIQETIASDRIKGGINGTLSFSQLSLFLKQDPFCWEAVLTGEIGSFSLTLIPSLCGAAGFDAEDKESLEKKLANVENYPDGPNSYKELHGVLSIAERCPVEIASAISWERVLHSCSLVVKAKLERGDYAEIYPLCNKLCWLLLEKGQATSHQKNFLELLRYIREKLIQKEVAQNVEDYLALGICLTEQVGSIDELFMLLLEGGTHNLSLASKEGFARYVRATSYYASAHHLALTHPALTYTPLAEDKGVAGSSAQDKIPPSWIAFQKILRVQGVYLQNTNTLEALFSHYEQGLCIPARVDRLSTEEQNQLLEDLEGIAEALVVRGCNNEAYQFYELASNLNERCKIKKKRFSLTASDIMTAIPLSFLENAYGFKEQLQAIRKNAESFLKEGTISLEQQKYTSDLYAKLIRSLFEQCVLLLDPKKEYLFALLGVGSLSRGEMCPFSDCEVFLVKGEITLEQVLVEQALTDLSANEVLQWIKRAQIEKKNTFSFVVATRLQEQKHFRKMVEEAKKEAEAQGEQKGSLEEILASKLEDPKMASSLEAEVEQGLLLKLRAMLENLQISKNLQKKTFEFVLEKELEKQLTFERVIESATQRQQEETSEGPLARKGAAFFKAVGELFHLQVLTLGETEWSVIAGKKSFLPKGFCLDTSNNPLCLCDFPEKLVARQAQEATGEDVVQLNVLRSACFLTGSQELYDKYQLLLQEILHKKEPLRKNHALQGIQYYLKQFSSSLEQVEKLNIKSGLLRLPVFTFEALCLYHGISTNMHTIDKIDLLCEKGLFPRVLQGPFKALLEFAFSLRWKAHLQSGQEDDELLLSSEEQAKVIELERLLLKPLKQALKAWVTQEKIAIHAEFFAPFFSTSYWEKALELIHQENYAQALKYLKNACSLKEDKRALLSLAQLQFFLGHFEETKVSLDKVLGILETESSAVSGNTPQQILQVVQQKEKLRQFIISLEEHAFVFAVLQKALREGSRRISQGVLQEPLEQFPPFEDSSSSLQQDISSTSTTIRPISGAPMSKESMSPSGTETLSQELDSSLFPKELMQDKGLLEQLLFDKKAIFEKQNFYEISSHASLWSPRIKQWLTVLWQTPLEGILENFSKTYTALPKPYRKEVKKELLSSFADNSHLLEGFFCEEGYIFSAFARRQNWLQELSSWTKVSPQSQPGEKSLPLIEGTSLQKGYLDRAIVSHIFQGKEFKNAVN